jgi:hypothetical protein
MIEQRITYMIDSHFFLAHWLLVKGCGMMEVIFDNLIDDFLEEMRFGTKVCCSVADLGFRVLSGT